jgi:hypothetical protein
MTDDGNATSLRPFEDDVIVTMPISLTAGRSAANGTDPVSGVTTLISDFSYSPAGPQMKLRGNELRC